MRYLDFNPRSHEGSDRSSRWIDYGYGISIHAPTKGATCLYKVRLQLDQISIHAPAKGATRPKRLYRKWIHYFNPRSREGSDIYWVCIYTAFYISIHAPAKGATWTPATVYTDWAFQSTLPRRERQRMAVRVVQRAIFQSTLPRRERPGYGPTFRITSDNFNPRSREGSDSNISQNNKFIL